MCKPWTVYIGEMINLQRELHNNCDRFTYSGAWPNKTSKFVGDVPRELV